MDNVIFVDQFRPIALGNFLFKVITKILADRLGSISSRIIFENQFGFAKRRTSCDSIVGASECFNCMQKKGFGGNFALKIDIRKAFDSLSWDFIYEVLNSFGFSSRFIFWISQIFNSARISILINGSPHGYFLSVLEECGKVTLCPLFFLFWQRIFLVDI